jgi:hypothetical protein
MSETQWPYTLHLSLNPEKIVCSGFQIGVSGLAYNGYISNLDVPVLKSDVSISTG